MQVRIAGDEKRRFWERAACAALNALLLAPDMDADRICEASAQYADKMLEEWIERVEGEAPTVRMSNAELLESVRIAADVEGLSIGDRLFYEDALTLLKDLRDRYERLGKYAPARRTAGGVRRQERQRCQTNGK